MVAFLGGDDYELNSNATSAVGAFDLRTGKRVFYSSAFNFAQVALGGVLDPLTLRAIQLDPKTRMDDLRRIAAAAAVLVLS